VTISFSATEKEILTSIIFKEVLKRQAKPFEGKVLASFWSVASEFNAAVFRNRWQMMYNLRYDKVWEVVDRDANGKPTFERVRWTVYAYEYDFRKEEPFRTIEDTKTLVVEGLLVNCDDRELNYDKGDDFDEDGY
jgi:hypothetical protein